MAVVGMDSVGRNGTLLNDKCYFVKYLYFMGQWMHWIWLKLYFLRWWTQWIQLKWSLKFGSMAGDCILVHLSMWLFCVFLLG